MKQTEGSMTTLRCKDLASTKFSAVIYWWNQCTQNLAEVIKLPYILQVLVSTKFSRKNLASQYFTAFLIVLVTLHSQYHNSMVWFNSVKYCLCSHYAVLLAMKSATDRRPRRTVVKRCKWDSSCHDNKWFITVTRLSYSGRTVLLGPSSELIKVLFQVIIIPYCAGLVQSGELAQFGCT